MGLFSNRFCMQVSRRDLFVGLVTLLYESQLGRDLEFWSNPDWASLRLSDWQSSPFLVKLSLFFFYLEGQPCKKLEGKWFAVQNFHHRLSGRLIIHRR